MHMASATCQAPQWSVFFLLVPMAIYLRSLAVNAGSRLTTASGEGWTLRNLECDLWKTGPQCLRSEEWRARLPNIIIIAIVSGAGWP